MTSEQREWHRQQCERYQAEYPHYQLYATALEQMLKAACRTSAPLAIVQARAKGFASLPWKPDPSTGVWRFDGERFDSAPESEHPRGGRRPLADAPKSFVETCRAFRDRPRVSAMQAVAFPVREAAKPSGP